MLTRANSRSPETRTRRVPITSHRRPPRSSSPPKARAYALTTQDNPASEKFSDSWMSGSATLMTDMSKATRNCAAAAAVRTRAGAATARVVVVIAGT